MAGPAPTELQTTDQDFARLHAVAKDQLAKANQSAETIPPQEQSPLSEDVKDALDAAAYAFGSNAQEFFSGKTVDTGIKVTPATKASRWALDRIKRLKGVFVRK